jgi:hypothetical protein
MAKKGTASPTWSTMSSVCKLAFSMRHLLTEKLENGGGDVIGSITALIEAIVALPMTKQKGRFSLEYKLARAAAEHLLPCLAELERSLAETRTSGSWSAEEHRQAQARRERLEASLGAFITLAHGI